jgi:hypothetical protein
MAVNTAAKKSNFISNVVAQMAAAKQASDALVILQAEYANQFATNQSLALVDADFQGTNGYMTAAQFAQAFAGFQTALAASVSNNLQGLLAVLPQ